MAERKTQYNKIKKPAKKLPDSVELAAKEENIDISKKPEKTVIKTLVTVLNGLNVRKEPSKASAVVRTLKYNEPIEITEVKGEWAFIGDGWVMRRFTGYKEGLKF
jgi:uncharacterized protein YgiM (DUF1202 family)